MPRPPNPAFDTAFANALALIEADNRAWRLANAATADYFDPPRGVLLQRLYLWAWSTREARQHTPRLRRQARAGIAAYRRYCELYPDSRYRAAATEHQRRAA